MGKKRKNRSNHNENPIRETGGAHATSFSPPLPPLPTIEVPQFKLTSSALTLTDAATHSATTNTANVDETAASPSSEGSWEEVKRRKKAKKEKPKRDRNYPEFVPSPTMLRKRVHLAELQGLIMWLVADGVAPHWLLVRHKPEIRKVVVLMIPGLSMDMFDGTLDLYPKSAPEIEEEDLGTSVSRTPNGAPNIDSDGPEIPVAAKNDNYEAADNFFPLPLSKSTLAPCLHPFAEMFPHVWPVKSAGDDRLSRIYSPVKTFLNSPLPKNFNLNAGRQVVNGKRLGVSQLLLTEEEMLENEYPLHSSQLERRRKALGVEETEEERAEWEKNVQEGWVETDLSKDNGQTDDGGVTEGMTIYSIDCEMCQTSEGLELTRISVLNWDGEVIYDTLVKPEREITDYLTNYSGMTKTLLDPITTTLSDVQSHLLNLLNRSTILVGQSLNSDFQALKLRHPHIIDTAIIYQHYRGPPYKPSLKWLSGKFLKREIQSPRSCAPPPSSPTPQAISLPHGHDSVEDAKACLDLLKLKLERGLEFGTVEAMTESIFKRFSRMKPEGKKGAVVDYGTPEKWYGLHATRTVAASSDGDVLSGVVSCVSGDPYGTLDGHPKMDFVWGRFRSLEILRGWNLDRPYEEKDVPRQLLAECVQDVAGYVKRLWERLPNCTAVVVYSGMGDPRELKRLQEMKSRWKEEFKTKKWDDCSVQWTDVEEQMLKAAAKRAREGIALLAVK